MENSFSKFSEASSEDQDSQKRLCKSSPAEESINSGYLQEILSLEAATEGRTEVTNFKNLLKSCHPRTRHLALRMTIKNGIKIDSMALDPCYIVRSLYIRYNADLNEVLCNADDQNERSIIATLDRLSILEIKPEEIQTIFSAFSHLVNAKRPSIRCRFIWILKKFANASAKFIKELFDKKKYGTFVYASEDESRRVRSVLVDVLYTFFTSNKGNLALVNMIFDFLVDLLNDEEVKIRKRVTKRLIGIVKTCNLSSKEKKLEFILSGLEEKDEYIKSQTLKLLSYLKYNEASILDRLISINGLKQDRLVRCANRIISRDIDKFVSWKGLYFSPFIDERGSLRDTRYLFSLLILRKSKKKPCFMNRDLRFPIRLIHKPKHFFYPEGLARELCSRIHNHLVDQEETAAFKSVYDEYCERVKGSDNTHIAEKYLLTICKLIICTSKDQKSALLDYLHETYFVKGSISLFPSFLHSNLLLHLQWLLEDENIQRVQNNEYTVDAPNEIYIDQDSPLDIVVRLVALCDNTEKRSLASKYLVVKEGKTGREVEYPYRRRMHLLLSTPSNLLQIYVIMKTHNYKYLLSKVHTLSVIILTGNQP